MGDRGRKSPEWGPGAKVTGRAWRREVKAGLGPWDLTPRAKTGKITRVKATAVLKVGYPRSVLHGETRQPRPIFSSGASVPTSAAAPRASDTSSLCSHSDVLLVLTFAGPVFHWGVGKVLGHLPLSVGLPSPSAGAGVEKRGTRGGLDTTSTRFELDVRFSHSRSRSLSCVPSDP